MRQILSLLFAFLTVPAWAATAAPAAGQLTMKLAPPQAQTGVREARLRLDSVEKDIARLDREIVDVHSQVEVARARGGTNSPQVSVLQSLASSYEMQKAQLLSEREQLIGQIKTAQ